MRDLGNIFGIYGVNKRKENRMSSIVSQLGVSRQREAFLRFYAAMANEDYDFVVGEYLGQGISTSWTNKLYMNVEAAIHFMNEATPPKDTL